jgi:hypothetical protein
MGMAIMGTRIFLSAKTFSDGIEAQMYRQDRTSYPGCIEKDQE